MSGIIELIILGGIIAGAFYMLTDKEEWSW